MMHDRHVERCVDLLGEGFPHVHRWLDEFAHRSRHDRGAWKSQDSHTEPLNIYHRKYRHTLAGVEYVRAKWGGAAALAAILHIKDDIYGAHQHTEQQRIPADEAEYVAWGMP